MVNLCRVTDHAVLRYIQRAHGVDVEKLRVHIQKLCSGPIDLGAISLRAEGVRFRFRGGAVLTVTPDKPFIKKAMIAKKDRL